MSGGFGNRHRDRTPATTDRRAQNDMPLDAMSAVTSLRSYGLLGHDSMERALLACPRALFLPEAADTGQCYDLDYCMVIKTDTHGQPISSSTCPRFIVSLLEMADICSGMRVLEIGCGVGFNAALLGHIVGPRGHVVTVELEDDLARRAEQALQAQGASNVVVVTGDGSVDAPSKTQFDHILLSVAVPELSARWLDMLAPTGVLVGIVSGSIWGFLLRGVKPAQELHVDTFRG